MPGIDASLVAMDRRSFAQLSLAALASAAIGGCKNIGPTHYFRSGALPGPSGDPTLPVDDPDPAARAQQLAQLREAYRYEHESLAPLPLLVALPERERFSSKYLSRRLNHTGALVPNVAYWKIDELLDPADGLSSFENLFRQFTKQAGCIGSWRRDASFAEQRLSGVNPMRIRRVRSSDEFPFALPQLDGYGMSTADAIAARRLFIADYRDLAFIGGNREQAHPKFLPTPTALFYWVESPKAGEDGWLMPVAISLRAGEVATPQTVSPEYWLVLKTCVQIADANSHEMVSHLAHAHLVMEPFAVSTARQLAPNHPVGVLLRPHFRFLLVNNSVGRSTLLNPGGIVEHLLAGTLEESRELVVRASRSWSVVDHALHRELEQRGVAEPDVLPVYAYRDDALLLWGAIERFVGAYLELYYREDSQVAEDPELLAWTRELADPQLGRVRDMPEQLHTRAELTQLLTHLVFVSGPQHAAVNYPQYDYMAFPPNMPLAAYGSVPAPDSESLEQEFMAMLPPISRGCEQLEIMDALSCYRWDKFGHYPRAAFRDRRTKVVLANFQRELAEIEDEIERRNGVRRFPYPFLRPSLVTNSASI